MPKKTVAGHKGPHAPAASKENAAKAAFDEYRKRMGGEKGTAAPGGWPGLHIGAPSMPQPQMFFAGAPGMPPPPMPYGPSPAGLQYPFKQAEGSLFGGLGNMVKLMVGVMNAGLAGGLQLMGGLQHAGGPCAPQGGHDCCCQPHGDCCSHGGHTDSCCEPCCDPCCRPSVYNCNCC